jgi:hypothetical protein
LLQRISDLQSAERRALLEELRALYQKAERELDAAMSAIIDPLANFLEIVAQFDRLGFNEEARSFVSQPPLLGTGAGSVVVGEVTLENWRRERDHRAVRLAAPVRMSSPSLPAVAPAIAAAKKAALKPAPVNPDRKTWPTRAARKVDDAPAFGFAKIVVLRAGLEIDGVAHVTGDELIVANDVANRLLRTGAADLLFRGEIDEAAE